MLSPLSMLTPIAVCVSLLMAGPASAADGKVSGRITYKGKPLAAGRVIFHLDGGQFVGAKVKNDGTYAIDRVPTGTRKITVEGTGLPAKFGSEEASGLMLEVKKGRSVYDIVLD
jgi:hypothetical protein